MKSDFWTNFQLPYWKMILQTIFQTFFLNNHITYIFSIVSSLVLFDPVTLYYRCCIHNVSITSIENSPDSIGMLLNELANTAI